MARGFLGGLVIKNLPANSGDMVRSLVQEDPTCPGATKPVHHNYRTCVPRARALQQEKPPQWEDLVWKLEKAQAQQWRPSAAKTNIK